MKRFVLLLRKSKDDKTKGISHTYETQDWGIEKYLKTQGEEGVDWEIVGRFVETISGGGYYTKRPECSKAVVMCREDKSLTLLAAVADRITRNLRTATELMDTINITLAEYPDAPRMELHFRFLLAEEEYHRISTRFKNMHKAKRERGEPVGAASEKYTRAPRDAANKRKSIAAVEFAEKYRVQIELMCSMNMTLAAIASKMKEFGNTTSRGKWYTSGSVNTLIKTHLKIDRMLDNKNVGETL